MTTQSDAPVSTLSIRYTTRSFPPYDAFHGTPDPMLWRRVTIETAKGTAAFEQTDYGHPGKLNPWDPRGVPNALAPKVDKLRALAEAVAAVVGE